MLDKDEIIPLKYDYMFTQIFNNKENICILEEFIAAYFNYELKEVRGNIVLQPRKLGKSSIKEKSKEVDLLLKYKNKNYNIEMSTGWNQDIKDRNVVFLTNIHGKQLERGDKYNKIDESIQLNLCAFKEGKSAREKYYLTNEEGKVLTQKLRIDVVYMEKLKDMCYTDDNEINALITWSRVFLCTSKKELEKTIKEILTSESRKQLISDISRLSGDENMVKEYQERSKFELEKESILSDLNRQLEDSTKQLEESTRKLEESSRQLEYAKEKAREADERVKEADERVKEADERVKEADERVKEVDERVKEVDEREKKLIEKSIKIGLPLDIIAATFNVDIKYIKSLK